jgi:hypothetical protein
MKTTARIIIAALVVLLMGFLPGNSADARGGHGGRVGVGIWLGPGWWGPYYYPYYYPQYYPYYQEPPVVIEQEPEVYAQPAPKAEQQPFYWYYCKEPQGYYPYVKQCPSGWTKVIPTPPAPSAAVPE